MDYGEIAKKVFEENQGTWGTTLKVPLETIDDFSTAYTPGVATICNMINEDPNNSWTLTSRGNTVAVISDGTAVLGLGSIGAKAAKPVMEGKAIIYKKLAGLDAIPLCIDRKNTEEFISTVKSMDNNWAAINLEDIKAPECFEIEERLDAECEIPVFHDDQHGTAIVVSAGLNNSLKVVNKNLSECKIVITGAGAAGIAISNLLIGQGAKNILILDSKGIIHRNRPGLNKYKQRLADQINPECISGDLGVALKGADIFIGVSQPDIVTSDMVSMMNKDAIIFALSNPIPEIMPDKAKEGGAKVIATGRSDFPNQVNNALVFPALILGAIRGKAKSIDLGMKLAAVKALSNSVKKISKDKILVSLADTENVKTMVKNIVEAVKTSVSKKNKRN